MIQAEVIVLLYEIIHFYDVLEQCHESILKQRTIKRFSDQGLKE